MFRQRALSAIIGLPVLFGLIYLDGFSWTYGLPLLAVVVAVSMSGAEEFRRMIEHRGFEPPADMARMMGALPPLFLYFYHYNYNNTVLLLLTFAIVVGVLVIALALISDIVRRMAPAPKPQEVKQSRSSGKRKEPEKPPEPRPRWGTLGALADFFVMAIGATYVGGLMSSLIFLRRIDDAIAAPWAIWPAALLIVAVWIGDTAAFAGGKLLDGPKLWPRLSPGKTIIGTVSGIVGCAVVLLIAAAAGVFGGPFRIGLGAAAGIGAVLGVAGLGGDLTESAAKRWTGVKDSGAAFPGHGGVLDRFDSLLWAAPVFFLILSSLQGR
jgi:CDP-diglyceride synthetase